jgi:hypothetical protein
MRSLPGHVIINIDQISEPASEPVSLARAFLSAAVDDDVAAMPDIIELMSGFITSARDYCENALSRAFVRRKFSLRLAAYGSYGMGAMVGMMPYVPLFPTAYMAAIPLPYPPLVSVESVVTTAVDGTAAPIPADQYRVETGGRFQGFIYPAPGGMALTSWQTGSSLTIEYTAGYSDDDSAVPAGIKAAMLMLTSHWYRNREATAPGSALPQGIQMGVDALLSPYAWGFYG